MVGAGVEVAVEARAGERQREHPQPPVCGGAQQQPATPPQYPVHLRKPAHGIGDVLDRLARPHQVEAGVGQRPAAFGRDDPQLQAGLAGAGAAQRLLGDVHPHDGEAPAGELGREAALAAAHVQHARWRGARCAGGFGVSEQEREPQLQVGRIEPLWHPFPDALVVVAASHLPRARLEGLRSTSV